MHIVLSIAIDRHGTISPTYGEIPLIERVYKQLESTRECTKGLLITGR